MPRTAAIGPEGSLAGGIVVRPAAVPVKSQPGFRREFPAHVHAALVGGRRCFQIEVITTTGRKREIALVNRNQGSRDCTSLTADAGTACVLHASLAGPQPSMEVRWGAQTQHKTRSRRRLHPFIS